MTLEEEQTAKTNVEQALYGWVEPSEADLVAFSVEAQRQAEGSEALVGDLIAAGETDDHVGKPTLSGA